MLKRIVLLIALCSLIMSCAATKSIFPPPPKYRDVLVKYDFSRIGIGPGPVFVPHEECAVTINGSKK